LARLRGQEHKFCGSAQNSAGHGKLWALVISDDVDRVMIQE